MSDFERIALVIRYLDANHLEQPGLEELAQVAGLSESHLHRLFHRWAGVTPKDFLQSLTLEHAKQKLRESASVLDAALDSGLSGPGRLHDLLVTIEAASPGELKSGGVGLTMHWGVADSPFGGCSIGWSARGICHLAFHDDSKIPAIPVELRAEWPSATFLRDDRGAAAQAARIFHPDPSSARQLKAYVKGTAFQLKVWRALLRIPEGSAASYRQIARSIGDAGASRAVGTACGANPVGYLIPCHRVIRETGVVQGYRWGSERKRALLGWESSRAAQCVA